MIVRQLSPFSDHSPIICWIKIRATKAVTTNNECTEDLFDLPRQIKILSLESGAHLLNRWAPDSRKKILAAMQTTEVTRLISDFENSDLEQTVDINEAVSKFVVGQETAAKKSLQ